MHIDNIFCDHCAAWVKVDEISAHEKQCKTKYRELNLVCHPRIPKDQPKLFLRLRDRAAAKLGVPYRFKGARIDSRFFCLYSRSDKPIDTDVKAIVAFATEQMTTEAVGLFDAIKVINKR